MMASKLKILTVEAYASVFCGVLLWNAFVVQAMPIDNRTMPDGTPVLIPAVQSYEAVGGTFALPPEISIAAPETAANEAELLASLVARHFPGHSVVQRTGAAICQLELTEADVPESPEGYALNIAPDGIRICARDTRGLYYGVRTLGNLLRNAIRPELPCCRITDWPMLSIRGIYLNLRRQGFPGCLPEVLREIDAIGALKYNYAMLEFGEKFPYQDNPFTLRENSFSREDIEAIKAAARRNHIEIIPLLQILSHDAWLHAHPHYAEEMAEQPTAKGWNTSSCPLSDLAREVQLMAIREQIACFQPQFFNLFMDEIANCPWGVCPRCKGKDLKKLWQDATLLYTGEVLRNGVRPILAHDMYYPGNPVGGDEMLPTLDKSVVFCNWDYGIELRKSRFDFFRARGFQLFSMSYCLRMDNMRTLPLEVLRQGCDGIFLSFWGDFRYPSRPDLVSGRGLAGFTLGGCYEWNPLSPPHTALSFDPAWETLRLTLPDACAEMPATANCQPIPLDQAFNAKLGRDLRFPQTNTAIADSMAREIAMALERFHLARTTDGGYFAAVVGGSNDAPRDATIPVHATAKWLGFLATAGTTNAAVSGRPVAATLTVNYADGTSERIPLAYNKNLVFWNYDGGAYGTRLVSRFNDVRGALVSLFAQNWRNPHPEKEIQDIVLSAPDNGGKIPVALLALSAETSAPQIGEPDDHAVAQRLDHWSQTANFQAINAASPGAVVLSDFSDGILRNAKVSLSGNPNKQALGQSVIKSGDSGAASCFNGSLSYSIVNDPSSPTGGAVLKLLVPTLKPEYSSARCRLVVDLSFDRQKAGEIKTLFFDFKLSHPGYNEWPAVYLMNSKPFGAASYMGYLEGRRDRHWHHLAVPLRLFKQDKSPLDLEHADTIRLSFFLRELDEPSEILIGPVGVSPQDTEVPIPLRVEKVGQPPAEGNAEQLYFID